MLPIAELPSSGTKSQKSGIKSNGARFQWEISSELPTPSSSQLISCFSRAQMNTDRCLSRQLNWMEREPLSLKLVSKRFLRELI
jgi:hypothetical protein